MNWGLKMEGEGLGVSSLVPRVFVSLMNGLGMRLGSKMVCNIGREGRHTKRQCLIKAHFCAVNLCEFDFLCFVQNLTEHKP